MSANVFDQFDAGAEKPEAQTAGNVFDQFDESAANEQRAGNASDQLAEPEGAKTSKADRRIQTLMDGWGEVAQQPAFRNGDWQQRQRLRGDYINNSQIRGLSGSEYDDVFGPFMGATESDVFGSDGDTPGLASNALRNAGERGLDLTGNALQFIGNMAEMGEQMISDKLGGFNPGVIGGESAAMRERGYDPDVEIGGYGLDFTTRANPEDTSTGLTSAGQAVEDVGLGYQPNYTIDRALDNPSLKTLAGAAAEQGPAALADMAGLVINAPAYLASRTQEIGEARVQNDGREGMPEGRDYAVAGPTAAASVLVDRFALGKLLPGGKGAVSKARQVPGAVGRAIVTEAGTEALQEGGIEYAGESVGTREGWDASTAGRRAAGGAIVGGPTGGAVRAGTASYEAARGAQPDAVSDENPEPGQPDASPAADSSPESRQADIEAVGAAAELIRRPRFELSSTEREARDSLAYGDAFKALRSAAETQGDSEAVAELDAMSEEVSAALEDETMARTRGENADLAPVRQRLDDAARRFSGVMERINGQQESNAQKTGTSGKMPTTPEWEAAWKPQGVEDPYANIPDTTIDIGRAAAKTDTSPTPAQAEAGNYRKGKVRLNGFEIAIENPKGSTRSGTDGAGNAWENQMGGHYGDIKGTEGADGDNLDVFLGDNTASPRVFVVDQVAEDGSFDETKTLMGYDSIEDAQEAYLSSYDEGWQGLGEITETTMGDFRQWVREGNTRGPFAMKTKADEAVSEQDANAEKRRETTFLPDNTPVETEFRVVDLAELTPSNRADGQINPAFPAELQPRDRTNANSQVQVSNIAARLNPERLGSSPDAGTGAPIIGNDGVVESGNGRTMAIASAYKQGGQRAQQYRDYVQQQARERGIDANIDGMRRPVLVRERTTDMDRAEFARRSNESQVAGMTSYEQAMADADAMSADDLTAWAPDQSGDPLAASNRDFQRSFVARLGNNEASRYTTRNGQAAPELGQRMSRAVFAKAYAAPDMVELVTEQSDQMRNLAGALQAAAPDFAVSRETGNQESISTIDMVSEAVRLVRASRRDGVAIRELIEQTDAFSDSVPEVVGQMAMLINTNMRSRATLESALTYVAGDARRRAETALNGALFEDTTTSEDAIREGFKRNTEGGALRGAETETPGRAGESAGESAAGREAGDSEGASEAQAVTLRPDGSPFQTKRAAELSKAYRETPGAVAVEADGGWGFIVPTEEGAPLLEAYAPQPVAEQSADAEAPALELEAQTEESRLAREQAVAQANQTEANQVRQESERAQADRDADDFLLSGSDSAADVAMSRGQDALFAFAGERAETANVMALTEAKGRLDAGEDAEAVRQETGWHRGADGQWRFEVDDSDARFMPVSDGSAGGVWTKPLGDVLNHPKLFAAYPSLRGLDVVSARGMGNQRGSLSAHRREINLNAERSSAEQLSTLLHEIQHGLQDIEGFATGGDPSDYRLSPMRERWLRNKIQEVVRESSVFNRRVYERYKAGEISSREAQQEIQKQADDTGLNDLRSRLKQGDERGAFRQYQRLAGEIEARNVQARQGMSEADRRETSPLDTADIPQNEAVVVYNGKTLEQAPPPANADPALPPNGAPYVSEVSRRIAEHPELAGVRAVQSVTELSVSVLDAMEARGVDASKVAGAYDPTTGESFVVADNLMDAEEGVRRAVHEAVGHQGIHGVLGADVEKVMVQVFQSYRRSAAGNDALREIRRAYPYLNPETHAGRVGIAEELVARSIEQSDGRPALRERVMAAIRRALRTLFPGVAWTDADIRGLGERARRYMEKRQDIRWRNPKDPAAAAGLRSVVRAEGGERGVSAGEAQRVVDDFMERYEGNAPLQVRVAATQEELYGVQASIANVGRLKGAYHPARGVMTIVASNANGVRDIQRTLRHEILGHYGLNTFTPTEKRILLDRLLETQRSPSLAAVWDTVRRHYPDAPLDIQAEEVFAHVAEVERTTLGQAWDRVLTGLQRAVRATGLSRGPLRLAELHELARQIGEGMRSGRRAQQTFPVTDTAQFSQEARDDAAIRFSLKSEQPESVVGPYGPSESTGFALPDESWLNAKLRVWTDKMRPLKRLRRAIQQSGGNIEEEADPYLAEELYHGRLEKDLEDFRHRYVEPLAEGLARARISQADLDDYVYALHAPERNAVVAERNPSDESLQDGGSGMTNAEAADIVEKVRRSGKQEAYDRLAKIIHEITAVRRDAIRDGGLETDDVLDAWQATYQHYVPLKGFANDEPEAPRIGKGFQITGKESFLVKGRRDRAASPSTQAIVDANMSLIRRRKNEVGNAFLSMVTDHPNPALWEVFTDDNPDTERATVRVIDPETGEKRWEVREQSVQMRRDDRYFKTKRAGRTYYIKVKDQRLLNAMRNVGPESNFWITRVAGAATRVMSSLMTSLNPEFLVTNFERDIQTALLNVGAEQTRDDGKIKGQRILWDTARDVRPAMRAAWRGLNRSKASRDPKVREWDRHFREFIEDGAKTGYFDMKDIEAQAKEIQAMVRRADGSTLSHMLKARKKTADFVENVNGAVENAVRLSAYANARRNGLPRRQAASLAKNLTVNFNRRGEIGTGLNAAYMFANASIQGSMNFARVMVTLKNTPEGKSSMDVWSRMNLGQKIGLGMAVAGFTLASLNRWLSDEDEDGVLFWDKIPDHVKERHYVLMTGWMTGNPEDYIKIPLPYGYNVFAVAGTHAEAVMSGVESPGEFGKNLGLAVAGSFSPIGWEDSESLSGLAAKNLTPTLARSLVQLGWNEDFAARLIYRENDPYGIPSPESSLYMRSTPEGYKDISEVLNDITGGTQNISGGVDINPDVIQHLVNYYGGGAWGFMEKTADFAARTVSGQEVENYRIPFAGRVLGSVTPYQDQNLFYQRRDELGQIFKEAESLGGKKGDEYRQKNRERIGLYLTAVDISNNLRDLRKDRDAIEVSEGLSDATKRERIENIEEAMKFQVDRFNRQYNALPE